MLVVVVGAKLVTCARLFVVVAVDCRCCFSLTQKMEELFTFIKKKKSTICPLFSLKNECKIVFFVDLLDFYHKKPGHYNHGSPCPQGR
jgi:hypothetical protein